MKIRQSALRRGTSADAAGSPTEAGGPDIPWQGPDCKLDEQEGLVPVPAVHFEIAPPSFLRSGDCFFVPVDVHNRWTEGVRIEVILRCLESLTSVQVQLAPRMGSRLFLGPSLAPSSGFFEGDVTMRSRELLVQYQPLRIPVLPSEPAAPTLEVLARSRTGTGQYPVDKGLTVERQYEDSEGNPFKRGDEGWEIVDERPIFVHLLVNGMPGRPLRLLEPLPAGMTYEGLDPEDSITKVQPGSPSDGVIEFTVDSLPEGGWTVRYRSRMAFPGYFLVPPARVRDLACTEAAGETARDSVSWIPRHPEDQPLSLVEWGPGEFSGEGGRDVVYPLLVVDGRVRGRGWVSEDGSVWETSPLDHRDRVLQGYGWLGLSAPLVLAPSPLGALALFLEVWDEWRVARPKPKRRRWKHADIGQAVLRLREGAARRVRARLRELGCPLPHVQRP